MVRMGGIVRALVVASEEMVTIGTIFACFSGSNQRESNV